MDDPRITTEEGDTTPTLRPLAETDIQASPPPTDPGLQRDREHVDTLAAFNYIMCGLQCVGLVLMPFYAAYIYAWFFSGAFIPGPSPFPAELGWILEGFMAVVFVLGGVWAVFLWLTARNLRLRRHRTFCFVIACIQCLHVPLGTLLGIFTILLLKRDSVKELFLTGDPATPAEEEGPRWHPYEQRRKDQTWLGTLAICHFVLAAFLCLFGLLSILYLGMGVFMLNATPPPPRPGGPPAPSLTALGWLMIGVGFFLFVLIYSQALMAGLTGYYIRKRKHWKFCLVGSGVECMNAPFGIVLCVFTVLVLMRQSVRDLFEYGEQSLPAPVTDEDYA